MKKIMLIISCTASLSGCAPTKEQKLATFSDQISSYNCHDLEVEARFINQMIPKIETASANSKKSTDIMAFTMALGLDNIGENSNASSKANYAQRVSMYRQKLTLIQHQQKERCPRS